MVNHVHTESRYLLEEKRFIACHCALNPINACPSSEQPWQIPRIHTTGVLVPLFPERLLELGVLCATAQPAYGEPPGYPERRTNESEGDPCRTSSEDLTLCHPAASGEVDEREACDHEEGACVCRVSDVRVRAGGNEVVLGKDGEIEREEGAEGAVADDAEEAAKDGEEDADDGERGRVDGGEGGRVGCAAEGLADEL